MNLTGSFSHYLKGMIVSGLSVIDLLSPEGGDSSIFILDMRTLAGYLTLLVFLAYKGQNYFKLE